MAATRAFERHWNWIRRELPLYFALSVIALTALLPLYFVVNTSLKTRAEYVDSPFGIVRNITGENYVYAATNLKMGVYLRNSLIIIPAALVLYILLSSMAGFAFGRLVFPGRSVLFLFVLFMMIFPQMIISSEVYLICVRFGLINSFVGITLVWVAYFSLFGTYIMTTYYTAVPHELVESARLDGASILQIMFRIMLPVGRPMLMTLAIIGFKSMWGELPFSLLLLVKDRMRTVTLGLAMMQGEYGIHVVRLTSGIVIALFVPIVVYLLFQRKIEMGATEGSLKG